MSYEAMKVYVETQYWDNPDHVKTTYTFMGRQMGLQPSGYSLSKYASAADKARMEIIRAKVRQAEAK